SGRARPAPCRRPSTGPGEEEAAMSCVRRRLGGGGTPCPPDCLPICTGEMDELRHTGWRWISRQLGLDGSKESPVKQYIGVVRRTGGQPFHATIAAPPSADDAPPDDRRGAAHARLGFLRPCRPPP